MQRKFKIWTNLYFNNPHNNDEWETTNITRRVEIPHGYSKDEVIKFGDMLVDTGFINNYAITESV